MAKLFGLAIVVTLFLGVVFSKDSIHFPGGDKAFHKWLNDIYTRSQISPATMKRVTDYVKKQIKIITDEVKNLDNCFDFVQLRGSTAEDLKILQPDEFDFVLYNEKWTNNIDYNEDKAPPGFAFALEEKTTCLDKYKLKDPKNGIDPAKVRAHMLDIVTAALKKIGIKTKVTPVGPSINFQIPSNEKSFKYIDIDLVLYIKQNDWPKRADPTIDPKLEAVGVGLVAKVLDPPQDRRVWQISFSAAEIKLFEGIDEDGGSRKKLLKIAKYLKIASKWPDTISSYQLKTELMKMNRDYPKKEDWVDAKIVPRFNELILNFLKALEDGKLTSFFIPKLNLLQGKDLDIAIKRVKNLISAIETKPDSCFPPAKAPCAPPDDPPKKPVPSILTNKIPTTETKKLPSIGKNKPRRQK